MKFALNRKTTKKILIGSAIFNYVLLVTYICLLLSTFLEKNYLLFIIGIPAYILSENWLLLIGIFGFEVCLILYWFVREKKIQQKSQTTFSDNSLESFTALDNEINLEEQIDSPKKDLTIVKNHSNSFL
ncbi:MAG: hypothetical protein U9O98_07395, partial [Asgard group archaeon]|nr:hypothetical protein [Asgard group archaeon]